MNRNRSLMVFLIVIGISAVVGVAAAQEDHGIENLTLNHTGDRMITEIIEHQADLTTFEELTRRTGVHDLLEQQGPFTVFAPTDEAFSSLPNGTIPALQQQRLQNRIFHDPHDDHMEQEHLRALERNATALSRVLLYHVVPGVYTPAELATSTTLQTVEGHNLTVRAAGGNLTVDNASIVGAYKATNGILYTLDSVLVPPDVTVNGTPGIAPRPTFTRVGEHSPGHDDGFHGNRPGEV